MTPGAVGTALADRRGATLLEIMLAATVFVIIAGAMGSLYVTTRQAFDHGSSQAWVQRHGALIQDRIMRLAQSAVAIQAVNCAGVTTASRSLLLLYADGSVRCIYQSPEGADTNADLFLCRVPAFDTGNGACTATAENLLALMGSELAQRLGTALRVRNTTFTAVTCVQPGGTCSPNHWDRSATRPSVAIRFDLTDGAIFSPQQGTYVGMRFGFGVTAQN